MAMADGMPFCHKYGNGSVFMANGSYLDRKYGKMANGAIIMEKWHLFE